MRLLVHKTLSGLLAVLALSTLSPSLAASSERPESLLRTLQRSRDSEVRIKAARELGLRQAKDGMPRAVLSKLLRYAEKDRDEKVRSACCSSLGRLQVDDARIKETLGRVACGDSAETVRQAAVRALGNIGEEESASASVRTAQLLGTVLTHNSSANVRENAAQCLADMGKKAAPAFADIQKGMRDSNERVCKAAVRAMGNLDTSKRATTLPELIKALSDPSLRIEAMNGISHLGTAGLSALPKLIPYLDSPQYSAAAANAIGSMGPKARSAIPALSKAVQREDLTSGVAALALSKLGTEAKSTIPLIIPLLSNKDDRIRHRAAEALGNFGRDSAVALPILERLAASNDKANFWSKRAAERAIKQITGDTR